MDKRVRHANRKKQPAVRVLKSGGQMHVWFYPDGAPRKLAGAINIGLAEDAKRYGQDLVGDLVDRALWMADRGARPAGDA